jgi:hypothetical protein
MTPAESPATPKRQTRMIVAGRYAMWGHPSHAIAYAPDGKLRKVRLGIDADSFFSWPGRCSIGGRTVRGYVTTRESDGELVFRPYTPIPAPLCNPSIEGSKP